MIPKRRLSRAEQTAIDGWLYFVLLNAPNQRLPYADLLAAAEVRGLTPQALLGGLRRVPGVSKVRGEDMVTAYHLTVQDAHAVKPEPAPEPFTGPAPALADVQRVYDAVLRETAPQRPRSGLGFTLPQMFEIRTAWLARPGGHVSEPENTEGPEVDFARWAQEAAGQVYDIKPTATEAQLWGWSMMHAAANNDDAMFVQVVGRLCAGDRFYLALALRQFATIAIRAMQFAEVVAGAPMETQLAIARALIVGADENEGE